MTASRFRLSDRYGIADVRELRIFDVWYQHIHFTNGDDLYLTEYGLPFAELLMPHHVIQDRDWFRESAQRLDGTSAVYRLQTKPVDGRNRDIVFKWNRMGEEVPGWQDEDELMYAEFNSPFEEFSLLMDLKDQNRAAPLKVYTQKPLAVFVPGKIEKKWRLGRKGDRMRSMVSSHREEIALDVQRQYAVIYEWIKGIDAAQAFKAGLLEEANIMDLTRSVDERLLRLGFMVNDRKPQHIILRTGKEGDFIRDRSGELLYGLVDYELLRPVELVAQAEKAERRHSYHVMQRDRFSAPEQREFPAHLKGVSILETDYVWGEAATTGGELWVVGRDPELFEFFLPERWEQQMRTQLSESHGIFHTQTKDDINVVWKNSKVGIIPDVDPYVHSGGVIKKYGYNSPFEEVSMALELSRKGIRTVVPRAIYRSGITIRIQDVMEDGSRYASHRDILSPAGQPVLRQGFRYIIIWGYWNGPDEKLAAYDGDYVSTINALQAYREGLLDEERYLSLMDYKKERLQRAGIEDLNLRGTHLLLSRAGNGSILTGRDGLPDVRICNFELLRKLR